MSTEDGAEVDFVIELGEQLIPMEIKWTEHPSEKDARHLPIQLEENILALPWFCL